MAIEEARPVACWIYANASCFESSSPLSPPLPLPPHPLSDCTSTITVRLPCPHLLPLCIHRAYFYAALTFALLLRHCNNRSPPCCYSPHVTTLTRRTFVLTTRPTWTKSILLPELVGDYNAGEVESLMKLAGPAMLSAVRIYIYNVPDLPLDCC